jgi:hypothetical protein
MYGLWQMCDRVEHCQSVDHFLPIPPPTGLLSRRASFSLSQTFRSRHDKTYFFGGEYVTWTFSPNNNGIAHQGRVG